MKKKKYFTLKQISETSAAIFLSFSSIFGRSAVRVWVSAFDLEHLSGINLRLLSQLKKKITIISVHILSFVYVPGRRSSSPQSSTEKQWKLNNQEKHWNKSNKKERGDGQQEERTNERKIRKTNKTSLLQILTKKTVLPTQKKCIGTKLIR